MLTGHLILSHAPQKHREIRKPLSTLRRAPSLAYSSPRRGTTGLQIDGKAMLEGDKEACASSNLPSSTERHRTWRLRRGRSARGRESTQEHTFLHLEQVRSFVEAEWQLVHFSITARGDGNC